MWGKWHLGSDPEQRSPVEFGFDEVVWCPRTVDEVLWTMQSYFPEGAVSAAPYAGETEIPLQPEPIYSKHIGANSEVIATYDAEFRAGFDRKITEWAIDFMGRAKADGKPFYVYLPYTQVHAPLIPDRQYAGKTKRGNWADLLTQLDDFTGRVLDALDELGLAENTIVVWASDYGPDPTYRYPAGIPRQNQESYGPRSTSRSARSPSTSHLLLRAMTSSQNHITASSMRVAEDGDRRFLHEGWS